MQEQQGWGDFVLDVAQFMERTPMVNFVLPELSANQTERTSQQQQVLSALIKIFIDYMRVARNEETDISWVSKVKVCH